MASDVNAAFQQSAGMSAGQRFRVWTCSAIRAPSAWPTAISMGLAEGKAKPHGAETKVNTSVAVKGCESTAHFLRREATAALFDDMTCDAEDTDKNTGRSSYGQKSAAEAV